LGGEHQVGPKLGQGPVGATGRGRELLDESAFAVVFDEVTRPGDVDQHQVAEADGVRHGHSLPGTGPTAGAVAEVSVEVLVAVFSRDQSL
jgi:hypothetical protein